MSITLKLKSTSKTGVNMMSDWKCPHCGGMPNWVDGPKSYCAKCNKIYDSGRGEPKGSTVDGTASTSKDVKIEATQ